MNTIVQIDKQSHLTGQSMRTLLETQELRKRGYRVILACRPGSFLAQKGRDRGLEVFPLRMDTLLPSVLRLSQLLRREHVGLVNAHGYPDHLVSVLAANLTGSTTVVRTKHNHVPLKGGALSRYLYGSLTGRVIAISEHIRDVMLASGLSPAQVTTIRTAVNLGDFRPREKNARLAQELNIPAGHTVIGIVARITERKGFRNLFEAVKLLIDQERPVVCLVVGGGANQEKVATLKRFVGSLGIGHHIVPTGKRIDIPEVLSLMDVFVLPSLAEGLGRSLLEAMAAGRPIVATRVGGIPEAIEDGVSGLLVPPGDSQSLASAIARLIDNPREAAALGRAARGRAEFLFDQTRMIDSICRLYEELLPAAGGGSH